MLLVWQDGTEQQLSARELRAACPCASVSRTERCAARCRPSYGTDPSEDWRREAGRQLRDQLDVPARRTPNRDLLIQLPAEPPSRGRLTKRSRSTNGTSVRVVCLGEAGRFFPLIGRTYDFNFGDHRDHRDYEILMVVAGFLAGDSGHARLAYQQDLRRFGSWCRSHDLWLLDVRRAHIELFARFQEAVGRARATITRRLSTISSFYRYCVEEELIVRSTGAERAASETSTRINYDGTGPERAWCFSSSKQDCPILGTTLWPLSSLLNGLRVSEAQGADIEDTGLERGHHTLRITRKGGASAVIPLAPRTARTVYQAIGDLETGPDLHQQSWGANGPPPRRQNHQATRPPNRHPQDDPSPLTPTQLHHCCSRRRSPTPKRTGSSPTR